MSRFSNTISPIQRLLSVLVIDDKRISKTIKAYRADRATRIIREQGNRAEKIAITSV